MPYLSVGDVGRQLGVNPKLITDLFYQRLMRDDLCPIVGGRRLIPESVVPVIAMQLRRKGVTVRDLQHVEEAR